MGLFLAILIILGVLAWQFLEGRKALATTSVRTRYTPEQAAGIIGTAFGGVRSVLWTDTAGPGTINKRRVGARGGITMSIAIEPLPDGGCRIDMWASRYAELMMVLVNFAGVVNRRKRAIIRMLIEPDTQQFATENGDANVHTNGRPGANGNGLTSYGYQPPRGASAIGWKCTNRDACGTSEYQPITRWPIRCPECGSPADPLFDQPWAHDALGVELDWQIRNEVDEADRHLAGERLMAWRLADALRRGDAADVAATRAVLHRYVSGQVRDGNWWNPGFTLAQAVREGLDAGDLDGAAEDLCFWLGVSTGEGAAEDYRILTNAQTVLSSGTMFLGAPGGSAHSRAAEIRGGCLRVAEGAFPELNRDLQTAVLQLARG
jgi:hypothetical protein